jgi:uncharacterized protein (TIGR02996 family)
MRARDLEALLAEIRAAPEDDAPRLVFADALTEAGDPWGELIVAACELARLDRERSVGGERYDALAARCREIKDQRWREKSLFVGDMALAEGVLERGFCDALVVHSDAQDALTRVEGYEFALLRELKLSSASESGLAALADWPSLPDLKRLALWREIRGAMDVGVCEAALERIAKRARLSSLSLQALVFGPAALSRVLASPLRASLRELEIFGIRELAGSFGFDWPALDRLSLAGMRMRARDVRDAIFHRALDRLASLELSVNRFGDGGVREIIDRSLAHLRRLDVQHTQLTASGLSAMVRAPLLRRLTSLAIGNGVALLNESYPPIGPLSDIADAFDALTELDVDEYAEQPDHVVDLVRRLRSPLRRLRLRVGASAVAAVAQLVDNRALALRELDLSRQPLGDAGAILLANGDLHSLEDLDLCDCEIGPAGARALAQSRTLPHTLRLHLHGNPGCSPESVAAPLRRRYPNAFVDYE